MITLWDAVTGRKLREWQFPGQVYASITPDGRHLATANANGTVYILRLPDDLLPPKKLSAAQASHHDDSITPVKVVPSFPLIYADRSS